jgi:hypothetical protein
VPHTATYAEEPPLALGQEYPPELRVSGLPDERVDARATPAEIARFMRQVPPLNREKVGDEVFRGKWVRWPARVMGVEDRGYCLSVCLIAVDGESISASFAPWERSRVEALRDGDSVTVDGQITRVRGHGVELVRATFSR